MDLWIDIGQYRDIKTPAAVLMRTTPMRKGWHLVERVRVQLFIAIGTCIVRGRNRYGSDSRIGLKALKRLGGGGVLSKVSLTIYAMAGPVR